MAKDRIRTICSMQKENLANYIDVHAMQCKRYAKVQNCTKELFSKDVPCKIQHAKEKEPAKTVPGV